MRRIPLRATLVVTCLLAAVAVTAAEAPPLAGRWDGAIQLPGAELKVLVKIQQVEGQWSGTIDIPQQGAKDLPLKDFVTGDTISFKLDGPAGDPTIEGTLSADGNTLTGSLKQGGATLPVALTRQRPAADAGSRLEAVRAFVTKAREEWKVPGLAVAIVKDGEVVMAEGFGHRDAAATLPVTPDTVFAIGSSTKAFTTLTLAMLVDEGKLDWDEPVADYLPGFRLHDRVATERMTTRDLVTHRSGLPRHDLVWYDSNKSREELLAGLRYLEPSADFRAKFQYQNLMFMTAGYLAGHVAGTTWEDLVRQRIFAPLGMRTANLSVAESQACPDFAKPCSENADVMRDIPFRDISAMAPAGSINASARDMGQWVLFQLGDGSFGGKRIVSKSQLEEMHEPQVVVTDFPLLGVDPEIVSTTYALGWFVDSYRSHERVHHGGAIDGFITQVMLLPDDRLGIAVMANRGGTMLPEVVARTASDLLLGLEPIDWSGRMQALSAMVKGSLASSSKNADATRRTGTKPSRGLDELVGEYEHPAYGTLTVTKPDASLAASLNGEPLSLEHWHFDTFSAKASDPSLASVNLLLQFLSGVSGEIESLVVPLEPAVDPIRFEKKPPARLSDPAYLAKLAGPYVLDGSGATIAVELRGSTLTVTVPGQPTYELIPYRGTELKLKGMPGYTVRFVQDSAGRTTEVLFLQPEGVYRAKPKA